MKKIILIFLLFVAAGEVFSQPRDIRVDSVFFKIPDHPNGGIWVTGKSFEEIVQSTVFPVQVTQENLGDGSNFNGITFIDYNTGVVVGNFGTILKTSNAGLTWYDFSNGIDNINAINTFQSKLWWVVANSGQILKSLNTGVSWFEKNSGTLTDIRSLFIFDRNTGWAGTENGKILKTTNGGLTWSSTDAMVSTAGVRSIHFVNSLTGYSAGTGGNIRKTTDGGTTWDSLGIAAVAVINSINFIDENTGWIAGNSSLYRKTTDGGASWTGLTPPSRTNRKVKFINTNTGYMICADGVFAKSTNGGTNWTIYPTGVSETFFDMSLIGTDTLIICGVEATILRSKDAGESWERVTGDNTLSGISFRNSTTGIIVGNYGNTNRTTNGGSWIQSESGVGNALRSVQLLNDTGYISGNVGTILKTTNSGTTWTSLISNSSDNLLDLHFPINANTGYVVGSSLVLKTTNAGNNWVDANAGAFTDFTSIAFLNASTGMVTRRSNSNARRTTNGGSSWTNVNISPGRGGEDIDFIDENTGWIAGSFLSPNGQGAAILKTTNGGVNWSEIFVDSSLNRFNSVDAVDGNIIYVTAGKPGLLFGLVYKSTNGGVSWSDITPADNPYFHKVSFINANTGWVIGRREKRLKTTNGGTSWITQ